MLLKCFSLFLKHLSVSQHQLAESFGKDKIVEGYTGKAHYASIASFQFFCLEGCCHWYNTHHEILHSRQTFFSSVYYKPLQKSSLRKVFYVKTKNWYRCSEIWRSASSSNPNIGLLKPNFKPHLSSI